ncbi:MAG: GNAT family N-acetyltransferase [Ferrovibrio sp.]|nr:GNAT family N-acetyltransferase [Ferrovibrio sp.]
MQAPLAHHTARLIGLQPPPASLDWLCAAGDGRFEVRLTRRPEDIRAAQRLRFQVFYEEMAAQPSAENARLQLDFDQFDTLCDHLMVFDRSLPGPDQAVGTYRLLRRDIAESHGGFYSASEFDISPMLRAVGPHNSNLGGGLLELGRSCVHRNYRGNAIIQLLWRGISTYIDDHRFEFMFGCASFAGTDPQQHAVALSYLYHHHLPPPDIRVRALPHRHVPMNMLPADQVSQRAAIHALPPLIKAYLRLGAYIGEGAVVDEQFGTTDVFILLPVASIAARYQNRFSQADGLIHGEGHA